MATDDVMQAILEVAEARWNEGPEELSKAFRMMLQGWWGVIVGLQRVRMVTILAGLHVPPRVAIWLAEEWPVRLLPALDLQKREDDHETPPGCPRTG